MASVCATDRAQQKGEFPWHCGQVEMCNCASSWEPACASYSVFVDGFANHLPEWLECPSPMAEIQFLQAVRAEDTSMRPHTTLTCRWNAASGIEDTVGQSKIAIRIFVLVSCNHPRDVIAVGYILNGRLLYAPHLVWQTKKTWPLTQPKQMQSSSI